eukprot:CAMPEP_0179037674 /NCGR_PEP_ID=MMETSP0796-20121207/14248_1 /TAXON_ID=73915 /ORGANISM="Pyrodinium bahamense, Strain pbaha01" /LENGTH=166 /DNA_ID=CAMNT_0020733985 /DNA_START=60 /DNA_END=557 /DNA_ORIENTATION=-
MFSKTLAAHGCALVLLIQVACSQDDVAFIQHTVSQHADGAVETDALSFEQVLAGRSAEEIRATAPQFLQDLPEATWDGMVEAGKRAAEGRRGVLARGWRAFYERSREFVNPKPQQLLQTAKLALVETGAMEEMRQMAVAAGNAQGVSWNWTKVMTLNSMMVGFKAT